MGACRAVLLLQRQLQGQGCDGGRGGSRPHPCWGHLAALGAGDSGEAEVGAIPAPVGGTLQPLGLGILGRPRWEPSPSLLGAPCSTWGWGSWGGRGGNRPHPRWGHIAALGDPGCLLSYCQLVRTFARESLPQRVDKALQIQMKSLSVPNPEHPPPPCTTHTQCILPCCLQG